MGALPCVISSNRFSITIYNKHGLRRLTILDTQPYYIAMVDNQSWRLSVRININRYSGILYHIEVF